MKATILSLFLLTLGLAFADPSPGFALSFNFAEFADMKEPMIKALLSAINN